MIVCKFQRRSAWPGILVLATAIFASGPPFFVSGQEPDGAESIERFRQHLTSGEFTLAREMAMSASTPLSGDKMLGELAIAQRNAGVGQDSFENAAGISNDDLRLDTFSKISNFRSPGSSQSGFGRGSGNDFGSAGNAGGNGTGIQPGGITQADFNELIELIEETIDPDGWEANGGTGRMRAFPSGVFVDPKGVLRQIEVDNSGRLEQLLVASDVIEDLSLVQQTEFRAISLTRLERALQMLSARGERPTPEMKCLGGIYRLTHVMIYPETRDVVIGGPAGPWHYDHQGRAVNDETTLPVLNLDDLVVCLRNAQKANGQFWCSIDPKPENLAAAQKVVEQGNLRGPALRKRLQETLGQQLVTVNGIEPTTHAGQIIVEADYHMKLIGMGVVGTVEGVPDYFERMVLDEGGNVAESDSLVRWWFSMNYQAVTTNQDRTVFEISGQGVKLLGESEFWNDQGEREHTGKSSSMAAGFAQDFTRHFETIAKKYPVYGEMRNLFDCSVAANLIVQEGLNRQIDWQLNHFGEASHSNRMAYQPAIYKTPLSVDSIAGQRTIRVPDSNKIKEITNVSGGVEFDAKSLVSRNNIVVDNEGTLSGQHNASIPDSSATAIEWNWDVIPKRTR